MRFGDILNDGILFIETHRISGMNILTTIATDPRNKNEKDTKQILVNYKRGRKFHCHSFEQYSTN